MFLFRLFLSFIAVGVHFGSSIASNQDALNIRAFNFFVDSLNEVISAPRVWTRVFLRNFAGEFHKDHVKL
jgi:hypothetical protein